MISFLNVKFNYRYQTRECGAFHMALMGLVNNGSQDAYLIASRYLFCLCPGDIVKLPTWKVEYDFLARVMNDEAKLPKVLVDIVVSYSGSAHGDALIKFSRNGSIGSFMEKLEGRRPAHVRRAMLDMLVYIANTIGYPKPVSPVVELDKIIALAQKIPEYDSWEDISGGLQVGDIFYQIFMLAWPPVKMPLTKIDNRAR